MYNVSNVQTSKTETHKTFQLIASSMRPHAKLEYVTKNRCITFQMFKTLKRRVIIHLNSLPLV